MVDGQTSNVVLILLLEDKGGPTRYPFWADTRPVLILLLEDKGGPESETIVVSYDRICLNPSVRG